VDTLPGVRLGLIYETAYEPVLAIKPFTGRFGGSGVADQVEAIIARDSRYSDRFQVLDSIPASLLGAGVDYGLWDQLGADWLVTGQVEGMGDGYLLLLELHDVVYGSVREQGRFVLPDPASEDFRMTIHAASDQVVEWITGEPGMAASRIVFSRAVSDSAQELYIIDSDGENLRRITNFGGITMSAAWHPGGTRMAYISDKSGRWQIYQRDLETGDEISVEPNRGGQPITPEYTPDGTRLAFSLLGGTRSGIFSYNVARDCCLVHHSGGRWNDLSPTFSPDGRWMAFNSNRLGTNVPQVYVMPANGGEADLISPYVYGQGGYFTSPDWSPTGSRVAFHGRIQRGRYHILIAEIEDRGSRVLQLTTEGNNEHPSWAPDGRHLVFAGERRYGFGLFVVDAATGRLRTLVGGIHPRNPDWSPSLAPQGGETLRGGGF
jgi:TolB protein